ncbi:GerAB/ArcD/ProY family transporter [Halalkalibacter hemicellulosilyticus]|uniref:Spore germination protein n=1 Tax=Halalkalibacter hemicellulosilyticusJCM 9152 TaxID=1236971 RepID=W4QHP8_9BACI|nr:endospore germination permease [Halalkalibacter hemicellulosilyticus]GAE31621.1 spore germination protein [Halalkalibacter hemicellulosilyticusJCM 9152]
MEQSKEIVSDHQMAFIFLCYMVGSALVNIPSPLIANAGNGAWISLLLTSIVGFGILIVILYLNKEHRDKTFFEYTKKVYGKWLSYVVIGLLLILLVIMVSNIILDVGMFLHNTIMRTTPLYIFQVFIFLVAALTVFCGIEVIGRMFTMLILFVLSVFGVFLLMIVPVIEPQYILPLTPEGWKPILHGSYFVYGFPYSEVILFAILLPYARQKKAGSLKRGMIVAYVLTTLLLLTTILISIMVLGPIGTKVKYALFYISTLIDVQDILTRIEAVMAMSWIIGSYMKATIVLYMIHTLFNEMVGEKGTRMFVFPITLLCFLMSVTLYEHELEFAENVGIIWPLFITIVAVIPITLMAIITAIKKRWKGKKRSKELNV